MTAILRSGKFLRLVSGLANRAAGSGGQQQNGAQQGPNVGQAEGYHIMPALDQSFTAWSAHVEGALPALTVSRDVDDEDNEEEMEFLAEVGNSITKEEILELLERIPELDYTTAMAQSVLVLRLCGTVLANNVPNEAERTELANEIWTRLEEEYRLHMATAHYNALLSVYIENGHPFCPEHIQSRLKRAGVAADRDTHENLMTKYCQDGDMEGANRILATMRDAGYPVGRHIYHCMINGHALSGDMKSALFVLDSMKGNGSDDVAPNALTYATLCKGFALQGDMEGVASAEKMSAECGMALGDGDYLEVIEALCDGGHKEHVSKVLARLDSGEERPLKKGMARLIEKGHDDVAFSLMMRLGKNSSAGKDFLEQLVRAKRPVSKLLWFAEELSRRSAVEGGMEILLHTALEQDNFSLSLKLAEIYVQEGNTLTAEISSTLLKKSGSEGCSSLDVLSAVRAIGSSLTPADIKALVIPHLEHAVAGCGGDADQLISNLEKTGIAQAKFVGPLVDYLCERGREAEAAKVAVERSQFVTEEQRGRFISKQQPQQLPYPESVPEFVPSAQQQQPAAVAAPAPSPAAAPAPSAIPMVKIFDANVNQFQWAPIGTVCHTFRMEGRFWDLEQLLSTSGGNLRPEDRKQIYMYTLQCYLDHGLFDKAVFLSRQLEKEGLAYDFPEYHSLMGHFHETFMKINTFHPSDSYIDHSTTVPSSYAPSASVTSMASYPPTINGDTTATNSEAGSFSVPATPSSEREEQLALQVHYHKLLKKAVTDKQGEEALRYYLELDKTGKMMNVTDSSSLIELLVKEGPRVREAADIAEDMLRRDTYPMPKIFRFLLNRLAAGGEVDSMLRIGSYLSPKIKKEVSFDNRLCNAYLSAGRGGDFLQMLQTDLDSARGGGGIEGVKDRFPRGGAMGLLESHPELIHKYSVLAHRFVKHGYLAPMNVLWTYYFINGMREEAMGVWERYVKDCPQIMFQKVCQTARSRNSLQMASDLVDLLHDATVTRGAQGIAYSCLLDVLSQQGEYGRGLHRLNEALHRGVKLEDVNRTALVRLKAGLEEDLDVEFPYDIPKKINGGHNSHDSRSESPAAMAALE